MIGFGDYVVHLAHMYMDGFHVGGHSDRDLECITHWKRWVELYLRVQ